MRAIAARTSGGYHDRWVVESKIKLSHRSRHEHRLMICRALGFPPGVDALNLKQSVAIEYLNRRRLLMEEAAPSARTSIAPTSTLGEDEEMLGVPMSGGLKARIAAESGREAAILKECRKAHEAGRLVAAERVVRSVGTVRTPFSCPPEFGRTSSRCQRSSTSVLWVGCRGKGGQLASLPGRPTKRFGRSMRFTAAMASTLAQSLMLRPRCMAIC